MHSIYKIIDPTDEQVIYIGSTKLSLKVRLSKHLTKARYAPRKCSIQRKLIELLTKGIKPRIELVMEVDDANASQAETVLIQAFKLVGHPLLNTYKM